MAAAHLHGPPAAIANRYRALVEVSQAIVGNRDLAGLFHDRAGRLLDVVDFDYLALVLHDRATGTMPARRHQPGGNRLRLHRIVRPPSRPGWTAVFLTTAAATSITGSLFPAERFLPSHAVGIVSLLVLPMAVVAGCRRHLAGRWRSTYVIAAVTVLYLNVFVLVAQALQKVPALHGLAPTGSEPPFALAEGAVLVLVVAVTIATVVRFRKEYLPVHQGMSAGLRATTPPLAVPVTER